LIGFEMIKPLFPMLTVRNPVYKLILGAASPVLEFEIFTRRYLQTLKRALATPTALNEEAAHL